MADEKEFPQLQASSLRKGFAVSHNGFVRLIMKVDIGRETTRLDFFGGSIAILPNETLLEVISTKINKSTRGRKGTHGKRNARTRNLPRK